MIASMGYYIQGDSHTYYMVGVSSGYVYSDSSTWRGWVTLSSEINLLTHPLTSFFSTWYGGRLLINKQIINSKRRQHRHLPGLIFV